MARKGDRMLAQKVGTGLARGFFLKGTLRPIIKHYVHPRVTGLENLSGQAPPVILAANHSSHMDTPLILNSLPRELRRRTLVAAASDYFFASRMLGIFVSVAVGAVPLDRKFVSRQDLATLERLLEQNWCLVVYPEGSRTPDGRLYKGKTGIARLALAAHVPVVPVGIRGTYSSMPAGRSWPISGHAEVNFGKPLTFDRYQHCGPGRIAARAVTDEIMYQIMVLSGLNYVDEYVSDVKVKPKTLSRALFKARRACVARAPHAHFSYMRREVHMLREIYALILQTLNCLGPPGQARHQGLARWATAPRRPWRCAPRRR